MSWMDPWRGRNPVFLRELAALYDHSVGNTHNRRARRPGGLFLDTPGRNLIFITVTSVFCAQLIAPAMLILMLYPVLPPSRYLVQVEFTMWLYIGAGFLQWLAVLYVLLTHTAYFAAAIARERQQGTWAILLTQVGARNSVLGKWLAGLCGSRVLLHAIVMGLAQALGLAVILGMALDANEPLLVTLTPAADPVRPGLVWLAPLDPRLLFAVLLHLLQPIAICASAAAAALAVSAHLRSAATATFVAYGLVLFTHVVPITVSGYLTAQYFGLSSLPLTPVYLLAAPLLLAWAVRRAGHA